MYETKSINIVDLDENDGQAHIPERALFCAVIQVAISDARSGDADKSMLAREAMDFLFSDRVDPYLELLDYDPAIFKDSLIRTNHQECTHAYNVQQTTINKGSADQNTETRMNAIARENKARRIFRHNYKHYQQNKKFSSVLPFNLIYESGRTFHSRGGQRL